jgi:DNA-binding LytR/AlgR family response regulator
MPIDYSKQIGKKIITKGHHKMCVHIESIMYIKCHRGLATIFLHDNSQIDEIKTLKEFEEDLGGMGFIRICRNTIVNEKYITKINTRKGKRLVYLGENALSISKRQLGGVKRQLS